MNTDDQRIYAIGGLQFSRPFRSVIAPQFELLSQANVREPILFGPAIWQMDHLKAPGPTRYAGYLHRSQVSALTHRLQLALSNKALQVIPHPGQDATQFQFSFAQQPVQLFVFHTQRPAGHVLVAAAPTASAAALMTPQQQIVAALDYLQIRHQPTEADFKRPHAHSHANRWLYE